MKDIIKLRDEMDKNTLIVGNGDVVDTDDARKKCEETGCDGVMIGRGIFGNPFLFANKNTLTQKEGQVQLSTKLKVMIEHTKLFEKMLGKHKNFAIMKKHYKAYVNGFEGAKELRVKLMEAKILTMAMTTNISTKEKPFLRKLIATLYSYFLL
jgi:tRNA-dihydrouridine synthase